MKIVVIGKSGQLARALAARALHLPHTETLHLGRPELDLERPSGVEDAIAGLNPDIVINAAAYTNVDQAEAEPERARMINAIAPEHIARGAARADAAIIHVSTDYVFDGTVERAYQESDPVAPLGVYGRTKCEGEQRVVDANSRHIIARTAWVYSPWGSNFVTMMLRLGHEREALSIIDDQTGNPTSAEDLADGLLKVARRIAGLPEAEKLWGVYHMAGTGSATRYELAGEIFATVAARGLPVPRLTPITTADYPTPAHRPVNSTLDCALLRAEMGVALPEWRDSLHGVVGNLLNGRKGGNAQIDGH